jgi:hypothetical protein
MTVFDVDGMSIIVGTFSSRQVEKSQEYCDGNVSAGQCSGIRALG